MSAGLITFWILVIRICFGFRASCFEFMENRISKEFSLSQQVINLNDVALWHLIFYLTNQSYDVILKDYRGVEQSGSSSGS